MLNTACRAVQCSAVVGPRQIGLIDCTSIGSASCQSNRIFLCTTLRDVALDEKRRPDIIPQDEMTMVCLPGTLPMHVVLTSELPRGQSQNYPENTIKRTSLDRGLDNGSKAFPWIWRQTGSRPFPQLKHSGHNRTGHSGMERSTFKNASKAT